MKKWLVAIGLIVICAGTYVLYNKLYYPPLPISSISKKDVVKQLNTSEAQLIPLTSEKGADWYITKERNHSTADNLVKALVLSKGWTFIQKEGNGLFFEKQGERLVTTSQMWTSAYVLIQIPNEVN